MKKLNECFLMMDSVVDGIEMTRDCLMVGDVGSAPLSDHHDLIFGVSILMEQSDQ